MGKPKIDLTTIDGNVFVIMANVRRVMINYSRENKSYNFKSNFEDFEKEAMSGDYDNAIQTVMKYCDIYYDENIVRYESETEEIIKNKEKPTIRLIGEDGNVFSILGRANTSMRQFSIKNKWYDYKFEFEELEKKVKGSESYEEALSIIMDYFKVEEPMSYDDDYDIGM